MTSRPQSSDNQSPSAPPPKGPVKLKDRIHLFEGLSTPSNGSSQKNTSSNNTEEVFFLRYPKVISAEQKRWTQIETGAADARAPPWVQQRNGSPGQGKAAARAISDLNQNATNLGNRVNLPPPVVSPNQWQRSRTLGARSQNRSPIDKPPLPSKPQGMAPTNKGHFLFVDCKDGNSVSSRELEAESDSHRDGSDIVYVEGTPVKLRTNNRKDSSDSTERRSSVSLMVNNLEKQQETNGTEDTKNVNLRRRSADVNQDVLRNETKTQTTGESSTTDSQEDSFQFTRRRSKSFSQLVPSTPAKKQGPPSKPKRTFEHDIYVETKKVITQAQTNQRNRATSSATDSAEQDNEDNDIEDYLLLTSCSSPPKRPEKPPPPPPSTTPAKTKKLPPIPNVAPYSSKLPLVRKPIPKYGEVRRSSPLVPHTSVSPTEERPRSESALVYSSRHQPAGLRTSHRSLSSEDISVRASPSRLSQARKYSSEYAEPILPADIKRAVSEESLFNIQEKREAVEDLEGYSVPGSHLWRKPQLFEEKKKGMGLHSRVQSWKDTLTRVRKISSSDNKDTARHTYSEPGTGIDEDFLTDAPIRQRGKFFTMRRKINDAFRRPKNNKSQNDDDRVSVTSEGSGTEVDEEVMHKRLTHARAVRNRSSVYCNPSRHRRILQESKLYEYLVVVTLEFNKETRRYQPVEKSRYPEELSASQNDKLRAIPHFCFPDAFKWAPVEDYQSESYSFVLTSIDGSRLYGYNRRLLPPGDKPRLPEVYCIITPISCRLLFTQLLDEIEFRRKISRCDSEKLIREAHKRHVPPPGGSTTIMHMDEDGKQTSIMKPLRLTRPQDSRLEHVDFDCLFSSLRIPQVIQIFASLLLERRVIMCSGKLSKLSKCSQAVAALLYPFGWQHVYVPVLPEKLIDMSCSPTPYIMGMLSLCIPKLDELPIDEVLIVDLDSKDFYTVVGDEETILPKKMAVALERALGIICSFSFLDPNNGEEDELSSEDQEAKNRAISEAFIRFFVETCGHYTNHFSTKYDGNLKFDRDGFIKAITSRSIRRFLEVFTETQMFSLFIQEKEGEVEGIAQGLFETRVKEWEAECRLNANKFGAKVKKIGRAVKGISRDGGQKLADTAKDVRTKMKANLDAKV